MAAATEQHTVDSLANLEERISRAVEMVIALRKENHNLSEQLHAVTTERDEAREQARTSAEHCDKLGHEIEELHSERKQVRARIEKLLSQMDLLSASQ